MKNALTLDTYLRTFVGFPFDWGTANCCHMAFGWVRIVEPHTDADLSIPESKTGCLREIAEHGSLQNLISVKLKRAAIAPTMAQVGDLVMLSGPDETAIGICNGRRAACRTEDGVSFADMENAICAWPLVGAD